jgi:uncharacterized damage-inducible protein DinB
MNEIKRILNQHRRAFAGRAWHGPSVREALRGVTAARAKARPIRSAHTIWEITNHIAAWDNIVRRRLEGDPVLPTRRMDWPPVTDTSAAAWKRSLAALKKNHERLGRCIAAFDPARLDAPPPGGKTNAYVQMHGITQHAIYHAGQIVLLKKALAAVKS